MYPLLDQIGKLKSKLGTARLASDRRPGINEPSLKLQELSEELDLECLFVMLDQFAPKKTNQKRSQNHF